MFTPQLSLAGNPSVAVQPQFDILLWQEAHSTCGSMGSRGLLESSPMFHAETPFCPSGLQLFPRLRCSVSSTGSQHAGSRGGAGEGNRGWGNALASTDPWEWEQWGWRLCILCGLW
jgi:hypothetical protein